MGRLGFASSKAFACRLEWLWWIQPGIPRQRPVNAIGIPKASPSPDHSGTSGPGAGIHLPSCAADEPVLTQLPHALSDLRSLGPLGHLAPSPHTFPTDHMYFSFVAGARCPSGPRLRRS